MRIRLFDLIRGSDRKADGYSRALQAARVRAAHQRSYFAPALFSLVPVETDLIGSMAVDSQWRLYYNEAWVATHTVEENASLLIHEVGHLLRNHEARKNAAGIRDDRRWNTAGDCEINDDLHAEGLPLPGRPAAARQVWIAERKHRRELLQPAADSARADRHAAASDEQQPSQDCGSGAHGERRFWELPADDGSEGGAPGVDRIKAELVRREIARRIDEKSLFDGDVPLGWRRWAHATLAPKVDYMATIRHVVRRALRDSTLGRYDRTYRRPHRRQACYGEFIMASFYQPRPRPGFLDRHVRLDGGFAVGESRLRTGRSDAPARVRRGRGRRVLRCRGARGEEGVRGHAGRVVRRRRHGHGRRDARVHRANRSRRSTSWSSSATA